MVDIRSRLGWKPDLPDQRDTLYKAPGKVLKALPDSVDLRATQPKIWDQSSLGACVAHATCGQCWFLDKTDPYEPSRLFVYYNTRILEGTVNQDSGASIRNGIKAVVRWGFCSEEDWPYQISKFTRKPSQKAYSNALKEKIALYARVSQTEKDIKAALAEGFPVNFGFSVYESFEGDKTATTGVVVMPERGEKVLGGHAVLLVGYDNAKKWYIVRNSWGEGWGDKGYFYMPYDYVHSGKFSSDFWVIKAVP